VVKNKRIMQLTKKAMQGINMGIKTFQSVTVPASPAALGTTALKIIFRAKTAAPIAEIRQNAAANRLIERGPGLPFVLSASLKKLNISDLQ
jgi:hypothetical protein